jgi:hypothetical protein
MVNDACMDPIHRYVTHVPVQTFFHALKVIIIEIAIIAREPISDGHLVITSSSGCARSSCLARRPIELVDTGQSRRLVRFTY